MNKYSVDEIVHRLEGRVYAIDDSNKEQNVILQEIKKDLQYSMTKIDQIDKISEDHKKYLTTISSELLELTIRFDNEIARINLEIGGFNKRMKPVGRVYNWFKSTGKILAWIVPIAAAIIGAIYTIFFT